MERVIGMDIHRTFAEVVFWEAGRLRPAGRVDMTQAELERFGRTLSKQDEVVVEATGNAMAVVRALEPHVARVIVANSVQVKAIAHAHVKTDKIDAGVLASLRSSGGSRRGRTQAGGAVLASTDQGGRLSVGTASPGRQEATRDGTAGRPTGEQGQQTRRSLRLQRQGTAQSGNRHRATGRGGIRDIHPHLAARASGARAP